MYGPTLTEKQLLQKNYNVDRLSLYERKSLTRLQFFFKNRQRFVKALNDQYQHLRIIVFAVLHQLYSEYTNQHQIACQALKKAIYEAKLKNICQSKGIQRQQLLHCLAYNFSQLTAGQEMESKLMNLLNFSPFFDQVLMRAILEAIEIEFRFASLDSIQKWMEQKVHLNIKIKKIYQQNGRSSSKVKGEIQLYQDENGQLIFQSVNSVLVSDISLDGSSPANLKKSSNLTETWGYEMMSPCEKLKSEKKLVSPFKIEKQPKDEIMINYTPIRIGSKKEDRPSFWRLLCCHFGDQ